MQRSRSTTSAWACHVCVQGEEGSTPLFLPFPSSPHSPPLLPRLLPIPPPSPPHFPPTPRTPPSSLPAGQQWSRAATWVSLFLPLPPPPSQLPPPPLSFPSSLAAVKPCIHVGVQGEEASSPLSLPFPSSPLSPPLLPRTLPILPPPPSPSSSLAAVESSFHVGGHGGEGSWNWGECGGQCDDPMWQSCASGRATCQPGIAHCEGLAEIAGQPVCTLYKRPSPVHYSLRSPICGHREAPLPLPSHIHARPKPQVGGQVDFHGMPGGGSTPAWVRLAQRANKGARQITVDADVSAWPRGGVIALASTTPDLNNAEKAIVTGVRRINPSSSVISLYRPLKHSHDGERHAVRDGFGGTVDVRAEVALLTRNIVIQGVHEQPPYQYDGGHFMVYMTRTPQVIHGVQFKGLGMQGSLGKYPLHFHMCGNVKRRFLVRKNVILESKQRCIVVHATSRVTIADNVAYETRGHCFVLEEGSEARNTFIRNLGMCTRAVQRLIPPASLAKFDRQTDDRPSTFWLATPFNSFVGNVAAGSEDSGSYWFATASCLATPFNSFVGNVAAGSEDSGPCWFATASCLATPFNSFVGNVAAGLEDSGGIDPLVPCSLTHCYLFLLVVSETPQTTTFITKGHRPSHSLFSHSLLLLPSHSFTPSFEAPQKSFLPSLPSLSFWLELNKHMRGLSKNLPFNAHALALLLSPPHSSVLLLSSLPSHPSASGWSSTST
ncbi:unnamed protein product [Closterium sp. Yama58-4]|nr:unnamed protein product [Closterium sp. Yama58-4]